MKLSNRSKRVLKWALFFTLVTGWVCVHAMEYQRSQHNKAESARISAELKAKQLKCSERAEVKTVESLRAQNALRLCATALEDCQINRAHAECRITINPKWHETEYDRCVQLRREGLYANEQD